MMSTSQKRFNLHIGMPKTGTKTLQTHMFPEHPELDFLGTYVQWRGGAAENCRDPEVLAFVNELLWKKFRHPDINRCKELYKEWADHAAAENKILLWSWESLMENKHTVQRIRARNLKEVVGEASVTVCLRNPVSLMKSLYIQLLKRDNLQAHAKKGKKHRFESIEQWMAKGWNTNGQPPRAHLEYSESLQVFADVFGKDSIKVLLFEQLVEDQDAFIRDFCNFLRIDPEQGVQLAAGQQSNVSWTQEQFDRLKELNHSPLRALKFRFSDRPTRASMLGIDQTESPVGEKVQLSISPEWINKIEEKTRAGNRMIQEQWGVPLEQYGYPV